MWHLRFHWPRLRGPLQRALCEGQYRFSPVKRVRGPKEVYWIWAAQDALVLKCLAIVLTRFMHPKLSPFCYHLTGRGGGKGAVRAVQAAVGEATFVFRSDVKSYYASINHECLMGLLRDLIPSPVVLDLVQGYLQHLVDEDGALRQIDLGISLGCPLSPLMGGVYLKPLDDAMTNTGLFYARFMDDWVVLAPSRGPLRGAIKQANQVLESLKVEKHPDKTFIGRVAHGFEFMGYRFDSESGRTGVDICAQSWHNHFKRMETLESEGADAERLAKYQHFWWQWVHSGVELNP